MRDGLDFTNTAIWTSERKRALFNALNVRVYVDPWPADAPHNPTRRRDESDEAWADRLERYHREVLIRRVRIDYPA